MSFLCDNSFISVCLCCMLTVCEKKNHKHENIRIKKMGKTTQKKYFFFVVDYFFFLQIEAADWLYIPLKLNVNRCELMSWCYTNWLFILCVCVLTRKKPRNYITKKEERREKKKKPNKSKQINKYDIDLTTITKHDIALLL